MNDNTYQELVETFVKENNFETSVEIRVIDLISEIGELSKEILTSSDYGNKKLNVNSKIEDEFGDVFFSLICIANSLNINMDAQIQATLNKYKERLEKKGAISSN